MRRCEALASHWGRRWPLWSGRVARLRHALTLTPGQRLGEVRAQIVAQRKLFKTLDKRADSLTRARKRGKDTPAGLDSLFAAPASPLEEPDRVKRR